MRSRPELPASVNAGWEPVSRRRHYILSVLARTPAETEDLIAGLRRVVGGTSCLVIVSSTSKHEGWGRGVATVLRRDPVNGECRVPRGAGTDGTEIMVASCAPLWMTDAQARDTWQAIATGGALLVHVARTGEAARDGLRRALRALPERVRLHEFSACWATEPA